MADFAVSDVELLAMMAERMGNFVLAEEIRKLPCRASLPQNYFSTENSGTVDSGSMEDDIRNPVDLLKELQSKPRLTAPSKR